MEDLQFLVNETFAGLSSIAKSADSFDDFSDCWPSVPGAIYKIEKSLGTFALKIKACQDLANVQKNHSDELLAHFKLDSPCQIGDLSYFACESFELAQLLVQQFSATRYPICEEALLNISDPSVTWWMESKEDSIVIHFKLTHTNRLSELVKLGPLSDKKIFSARIQLLLDLLSARARNCSLVANKLVIPNGSENFLYGIKELLSWGTLSSSLIKELENKSSIYSEGAIIFLKEIAVLRRFWMLIEHSLTGYYSQPHIQ